MELTELAASDTIYLYQPDILYNVMGDRYAGGYAIIEKRLYDL